MSIGVWFLILHLVICVVTIILMAAGVIMSGKKQLVIVLAVPFWGICCLALLERALRGKSRRGKETGLEKLKINDEIFRSILKDEDRASGDLVPFEDALVVNDAKTRRELVMDIMYSDPSEYIDLLKHARMDEDTEVVHYATTAMVELQKDYDAALKAEAEKTLEEPESPERLREYARLLTDYIGSGLLEGNMLYAQRVKLSEILGRYLKIHPEDRYFLRNKAGNDMILKNYEVAFQCIRELLARWPEEEDGYLLMLQYELVHNSREGIDRVLDELRRAEVPLSPAGKDTVRFWTEGERYEETAGGK